MSGLLKLGRRGSARMAEVRCVLGERSIYFAAGLTAVLHRTRTVRVVAHASDPDELVSCVARASPDVVLVGFEPIPESIALAPRIGPGHPVIVLASSPLEDHHSVALSAGVRCIVRKDATLSVLTVAIRKAAGVLDAAENRPASLAQSKPISTLTPREEEIVQLVVEGRSSKQIAKSLEISLQTVKNHLHNVMTRVGASSRVQLCMWALETGHASHRTLIRSEG